VAIDFSIESKDLLHALKPFFAGRARGKAATLDYIDITAKEDEVEFVSTGMASSVGAEVVSSGCARVPYPIFEALFRKPEKYGVSRLAIHIENGQIKAGPTILNHPGVTIQAIGARIADLPIDASVVDTLGLSFRFNTNELADSGLDAKVRAAQQRADDLIDQATKLLEPLEINRDALTRFVFDQIKARQSKNR
jgi:hypothetical protein